ncbi:flagellar motor switch protein FliM [Syntrophotalea carbinolica DSM 2380]|uniref:Flagellar motor switch protein FliM n=1 Tax=Syntrophotalea carbinolica (strain DSM 2380 / NBRC 103641 / GraBd1) TaxID=338963 RepID=Q3A5D9_SYNC1|nr:FliM/FliN family flagellar motor switch protein [Syntrophotalea carbinolica]ABA88418.1 flagellar motor switch protein FliM [Syntrophotalea carbinolica DSM 2380]
MERILSKEEIAELLSAVHDGEIPLRDEEPEPPAEVKREISSLNLVALQGPRHCKIENFDLVLDTLARHLGISLTNRMQRSIGVRRSIMQVYEYDTFLQQLAGRDALGVIRLDPLRWRGVFIFKEKLAFYLLEHLLGGAPDVNLNLPGRSLTAIETSVLRNTIADACLDLNKTFAPLEKIESSLVKIESSTRLINIVPGDASVLAAHFVVTGNNLEDEIVLVLPMAMLDPLKEKMREGSAVFSESQDRPWQTQLEQEIEQMDVDLSAQMATLNLTVRDILNFKVGDILDLGCAPSSPLQVRAAGQPKFQAIAGTHQGKKAVRISGRINRNNL